MVRVVGHRGTAGLAPENTIKGFRKALSVGVDSIEFDVRLSADGTPVVIHDPAVERTTDGEGKVSELTVSEIKSLDAGGAEIPLLDEALDFLNDKEVWIRVELKEEAAAEPALDEVMEHGLVDRTMFISFHRQALEGLDGYRKGFLSLDREAALKNAEDLDCEYVLLNHENASQRFVRKAHEKGFKTGVWTLETRREIEEALELGTDSLTTDRPDLVP